MRLVTARVACYGGQMDPDELIGNDAAAAHVGLRSATWRHYVHKGQAPPPHRRDSETRPGHGLPVWRQRDLDEWMAQRPGRGAPGRPRRRAR